MISLIIFDPVGLVKFLNDSGVENVFSALKDFMSIKFSIRQSVPIYFNIFSARKKTLASQKHFSRHYEIFHKEKISLAKNIWKINFLLFQFGEKVVF